MDRIVAVLDELQKWKAGPKAFAAGIIFLLIGTMAGAFLEIPEHRLDRLFWAGGILVIVGLFFEWYRAAKEGN